MELKQLRLFLAVAEELNVTRAASRMHIPQPARSQQILNLERLLGTALFRRNKRVVALTQAGEEFQLHARKVLKAADEAMDAVCSVRDGRTGRLSIGAVYSAVYAILRSALAEFRERHPHRVASIFAAKAEQPDIAGYTSDMHTVLCTVLAGLGASVVPASVAAMNDGRLAFRPIVDSAASMDSTLVWQQDSGCSCMGAFVDIAKRLSLIKNEGYRFELSNGSRIDMLTI